MSLSEMKQLLGNDFDRVRNFVNEQDLRRSMNLQLNYHLMISISWSVRILNESVLLYAGDRYVTSARKEDVARFEPGDPNL